MTRSSPSRVSEERRAPIQSQQREHRHVLEKVQALGPELLVRRGKAIPSQAKGPFIISKGIWTLSYKKSGDTEG